MTDGWWSTHCNADCCTKMFLGHQCCFSTTLPLHKYIYSPSVLLIPSFSLPHLCPHSSFSLLPRSATPNTIFSSSLVAPPFLTLSLPLSLHHSFLYFSFFPSPFFLSFLYQHTHTLFFFFTLKWTLQNFSEQDSSWDSKNLLHI
ncbi:hypothetical protein OTU49_003369 [Cherax quadricarinatus]|uniref:Uncharacterized protein n=1 Tax=Cherax quadricarinatus TaxID=27406 RepID=A0AAW0X8V2_CHEQU